MNSDFWRACTNDLVPLRDLEMLVLLFSRAQNDYFVVASKTCCHHDLNLQPCLRCAIDAGPVYDKENLNTIWPEKCPSDCTGDFSFCRRVFFLFFQPSSIKDANPTLLLLLSVFQTALDRSFSDRVLDWFSDFDLFHCCRKKWLFLSFFNWR